MFGNIDQTELKEVVLEVVQEEFERLLEQHKIDVMINTVTNELLRKMKSFTTLVKEYSNTCDNSKKESIRIEAEVLYNEILVELPINDPRRRAIESFRTLLI